MIIAVIVNKVKHLLLPSLPVLTLLPSLDVGVQQYFAAVWFAVWRSLCWASEIGRKSKCDSREHAPPGRTAAFCPLLFAVLQTEQSGEHCNHRGSFCSQTRVAYAAHGSLLLVHCLSYDLMIKSFHPQLVALLVCISTMSVVLWILPKPAKSFP